MKFEEILPLLRQGKRARRSSWDCGVFVDGASLDLGNAGYDAEDPIDPPRWDWVDPQDDLLEEDWEEL